MAGLEHGHASPQTPTYRSWASMMRRCYNPNETAYSKYGANGITVDTEWHDFATFLKDMGIRPEGTSLDRLHSTDSYGPGKCKWSTQVEQQNNRKDNTVVTFAGKSLTLAQWQSEIGISQKLLGKRIRSGWEVQKAFRTPAGTWTGVSFGN